MINIWIDTDPGIDDALALAMAAASKKQIHVIGISSCGGNSSLETVTENALRLSSFLGLDDAVVVRGAAVPLVRKKRDAEAVHGANGLGNVEIPETDKKAIEESPFLAIRNKIMEVEGKITFVTLAPLTNVATLLRAFPELKNKIEKIVMMGGSAGPGNDTPYAEFNIWGDPEAAHIVYNSGLPIVMCGLDVTTICGMTREAVADLVASDDELLNIYGRMMDFEFNQPYYINEPLLGIHDATTILYLRFPELFGGVQSTVKVDCSERETVGQTVCTEDPNGNVLLLNQVDQPKLMATVIEMLKELSDSLK